MAQNVRRVRTPFPPRLALGWHIVLAILLGSAITGVALLAVWWWLLGHPALHSPAPMALTPADRYGMLKIGLTVTGGVVGATALVIGYRKQRLAELSHIREDNKLLNERYATAATQIGSDKAAVRLAGVYTMTHLADVWDTGRQTCIDVLCAYLRMPYRPPVGAGDPDSGDDPADGDERAAHEERQVRHTIIRTIRDHLRPDVPVGWHGCEFDFTSAVFDGADFGGADFTGTTVSFRSARFVAERTSFDRALFQGDAEVSFERAEFNGAGVSFTGAEFAGGRISFHGARLLAGVVDLSKPARWQCPPRLDGWLTQPPRGLLLPSFRDELTAILNSYESRFVLVTEDTSRTKITSIRQRHSMPPAEQLLGYAREFGGHGGVACTSAGLRINDGNERRFLAFNELADVDFDTVYENTVGTDQGPAISETTNVRVRYRNADQFLQFGGPDANAAVLDVLMAVRRLACRRRELPAGEEDHRLRPGAWPPDGHRTPVRPGPPGEG